jgi:hypothetical protein
MKAGDPKNFLRGKFDAANTFKHLQKIGARREAHGSISVQEGQPYTSLI